MEGRPVMCHFGWDQARNISRSSVERLVHGQVDGVLEKIGIRKSGVCDRGLWCLALDTPNQKNEPPRCCPVLRWLKANCFAAKLAVLTKLVLQSGTWHRTW